MYGFYVVLLFEVKSPNVCAYLTNIIWMEHAICQPDQTASICRNQCSRFVVVTI